MRRLFLLVLMLCCLAVSAVASAAQVTDVKWGVDKDNMLRFVVDLTDAAPYKIEVNDKLMTVIVDAPLKEGVAKSSKTRSTVASVMKVEAEGNKTLVKIPLSRALKAEEYKSFTLRKDPETKRPARIVLDMTAEKRVAPAKTNTKAEPKAKVSSSPASGTAVVGNKPASNTLKKPPEVAVSLKGNVSSPTVSVSIGGGSVEKPKSDREKEKERKRLEREKRKKEKEAKKKKKNKGKAAAVKPAGTFATTGGIEGKIITIDPGHGGSDPGAVGDRGTLEKNITLEISKRLKKDLEKMGAIVHMTRSTDTEVAGPGASDVDELQARINVAEKHRSDLFISVHINSSVNKKVGGFSTYYYPKTKYDAKVAKSIQDNLTENFGRDNLGLREANFYVIKRCSMPATLLELCFISNKKEEKLMRGNWFQTKTAKLIAEGVERYFK